jgi:hypothetical protein
VAQDFFTDTSDVDQLMRALGRIREQIAAAKTIESSILDHLKRLNATVVIESHNQMVIDGLDTSSSLSTPVSAILNGNLTFATAADDS